MEKIKILHIITELNVGGAEIMLFNLLSGTDRSQCDPHVISLIDIGPVGKKIENLGVEVRCLGMKPGMPDPIKLLKLARIIREMKPDVIQTWLWHADLIGAIAAKLSRLSVPVVWGIHVTEADPDDLKMTSSLTMKACSRLSRSKWGPEKIICCSGIALKAHENKGYSPANMLVINNGVDTEIYKPDSENRVSARHELGVPENVALIGMVARFHPMKDHNNFIKAAGLLSKQKDDVYFLLCGLGITKENAQLTDWINEEGIANRLFLLGVREDIPRILSSLDVATLSSYSEAFPLSITEAMSCGVPCVATDAGDSALIIGNTGEVVPIKNPKSLSGAWLKMIEAGPERRMELGIAARKRVEERFSLQVIVKTYEELYYELVRNNRGLR